MAATARPEPEPKEQPQKENIMSTAKEYLKRITDEAIGITSTFVEATLEPGEYYIYTEVWQLTTEQLDKIRSKVTITSLSVDGGRIMLTAKYKTMEKKIREEESAAEKAASQITAKFHGLISKSIWDE